jgi:hypothetical protein
MASAMTESPTTESAAARAASLARVAVASKAVATVSAAMVQHPVPRSTVMFERWPKRPFQGLSPGWRGMRETETFSQILQEPFAALVTASTSFASRGAPQLCMRGHSLDLQGLATAHPATLARVSHIFSSDLRERPYFAGVSSGNASEHFLRNSLKTIPGNSRRGPFLSRCLRRRGQWFVSLSSSVTVSTILRGSKTKNRGAEAAAITGM